MKYVEMGCNTEAEQIAQICTAIEGGLKTGVIVDDYKIERFKKLIFERCKVSVMVSTAKGLTKDTTVLTFTKYAHGVQ
jgi:hypothetical protein